jgi:hypothetical protein
VHKNKTKRQQRTSSLLFSLGAQKQKKKKMTMSRCLSSFLGAQKKRKKKDDECWFVFSGCIKIKEKKTMMNASSLLSSLGA